MRSLEIPFPLLFLPRLPPMHIVLLTGHTREHVILEEPMASVLFAGYVYTYKMHDEYIYTD